MTNQYTEVNDGKTKPPNRDLLSEEVKKQQDINSKLESRILRLEQLVERLERKVVRTESELAVTTARLNSNGHR